MQPLCQELESMLKKNVEVNMTRENEQWDGIIVIRDTNGWGKY